MTRLKVANYKESRVEVIFQANVNLTYNLNFRKTNPIKLVTFTTISVAVKPH